MKISRFFLAVSNFLLTFATVYKMIVIYPAGRPFRLWLLAAGFFMPRKIFFSNWENNFSQLGKQICPIHGGCMNRKI